MISADRLVECLSDGRFHYTQLKYQITVKAKFWDLLLERFPYIDINIEENGDNEAFITFNFETPITLKFIFERRDKAQIFVDYDTFEKHCKIQPTDLPAYILKDIVKM